MIEGLQSNQVKISSASHNEIDGLVQERRNSTALAMELWLSCINSSWYDIAIHQTFNALMSEQNAKHFAGKFLKIHFVI